MSEAKANIERNTEVEADIEFVDPSETVALAGSTPRQLTGQEAGRVVGFGCDEDKTTGH